MRACIGAAGAGKTERMRRLVVQSVRSGWRCVVADLNGEWSALPVPTVTADPAGVAVALRDQSPRVVVVRLPRALGVKAQSVALETVAAAVVNAGRAVLVLPEAGTWLPLRQPVGESVYSLLTRWRHLGCGLFLDFQRFAQVSTEARDACRVVYCFAASNEHDRDRYRELGGAPLVVAVDECAARWHRGEAGWHVEVHPNAPKARSYPLVRHPTVA